MINKITASARVVQLRAAALNKDIDRDNKIEWKLGYARNYLKNNQITDIVHKRGVATGYILSHSTPVIDDGELIVGKPLYSDPTSDELNELEIYKDSKFNPGGMKSHMAIDYEKLLSKGLSGVMDEINSYRSKLDLNNNKDIEKEEFYLGCLSALEGVKDYSNNYATHAKKMAASCKNKQRKSELLKIAEICRKVPNEPASSFREALQAIHFFTFCLNSLYQLGRPDRYLIKYYNSDIELGIINPESAQELIDCLCILFNEYTQKGLAVGFMVGGRDEIGNDITNELTYLFINSIGHTRLIYPGIGLCYTNDTPKDLLNLSCRLLGEGLSHPALFNDKVITEGLETYGLPKKETCNYVHSTCVEITPVASSAVWVACPYINLVQILLDILETDYDGKQSENLNFKMLISKYRQALRDKINIEAVSKNELQEFRSLYGGDPLVSCFVNDCLEVGKDIDRGGARYNWIMPSFVGLANLADSMIAIKYLVYDNEKISMKRYVKALKTDFKSDRLLLSMIQNTVPSYGNDNREADSMVAEISKWIREYTTKNTTFRNDRFVPSLFCWVNHERMGRVTGASPDGRRRGFPLGDGSGPVQGRGTKGPTASIMSATSWGHKEFIGGIAVNMKFNKSFFNDDSIENMMSLVNVFMERGGFELQINSVDQQTLLNARENPQEYRDLIVRIGGYSDYFIHLNRNMQDEVIARSGQNI